MILAMLRTQLGLHLSDRACSLVSLADDFVSFPYFVSSFVLFVIFVEEEGKRKRGGKRAAGRDEYRWGIRYVMGPYTRDRRGVP